MKAKLLRRRILHQKKKVEKKNYRNMADEDISLNEDQLLDDVNGEAELLNEVSNVFYGEFHSFYKFHFVISLKKKRMKLIW